MRTHLSAHTHTAILAARLPRTRAHAHPAYRSFITWLRSGDHDDETLRAAARSMRHSDSMQASGAYDKEKHDRLNKAAVTVAAAYAARFQPSQPRASTSNAMPAKSVQPAA